MKLVLLNFFLLIVFNLFSQKKQSTSSWEAQWIGNSIATSQDSSNVWTCYRRTVTLKSDPKSAIAKIAVDSKYWLWVNGQLVVFEGGLKRGPNPTDTYYDKVDLTPYLNEGMNTIAVLSWYWGKHGFAHNSSGKAGMLFEANIDGEKIKSDNSWKAIKHPAYESTKGTQPNFRLAEHNIRYDARKELEGWMDKSFDDKGWANALELGVPPTKPWNNLVQRPIPLFKDFGLKNYENNASLPKVANGDTIKALLPYNAQVTPYLKIKAPSGSEIEIMTDDYFVAGNKDFTSVRAEYVTKDGVQEYETYGWMNGHEVHYVIPKGVEIIDLKYRETGYPTEFAGSFTCNDDFYNVLWKKSQRTLYLNMRDNYFDCPDRERALWWGDVVLELGEAFYALDTNANMLTKKSILELVNWQKKDKTMFAPVPSGNWANELPPQILASISTYGFWTYYLYTGDAETMKKAYPHVRDYLSVWKIGKDGLVIHRKGGWDWADWGTNIDVPLQDNAWYILALEGAKKMARLTGNVNDIKGYEEKINTVKTNFNKHFWNGKEYRSKEYKDATDDRGNAMAVLTGIADESKWGAIKNVLNSQHNASPYMEKYVLEAFYFMNDPEGALARMRKRYKPMVESPLSTIWELFVLDENSTYNHGWSGGPLTLLSQYAAGLAPIEAGYKKFQVLPQLGGLNSINSRTTTVAGPIKFSIKNERASFTLEVNVPKGSDALIGIPKEGRDFKLVELNGNKIWENHKIESNLIGATLEKEDPDYIIFKVSSGNYVFNALTK